MSSKADKPYSTDITYVVTHGFAARMVVQTDLLGQLANQGLKVALISPDANDENLKPYCDKNGITLYEYQLPPSRIRREFSQARRYFLDNIYQNPAVYERHVLATRFNRSSSVLSYVRPRVYMSFHWLKEKFPVIKRWFIRRENTFIAQPVAVELLREINTEVFVSTYPVNYEEGSLIKAAKTVGAKTVTHLLSWDNISCKGRFPQLTDEYILWGEVMRKELKAKYGVADEVIHVPGVPHFDVHYRSRNTGNPGPHLSKLGLQDGKAYLFFGMSASHFAPREIDIVEWLADEIRKNTFGPELQLVVRPHPQNIRSSFSDQSWLPRLEALQGNRVGVAYPSMAQSGKMPWSMHEHDMQVLSELIAGSSICYNTGSTISIDGLMCGVPVILTPFDANDTIDYWHGARRVKDYNHLASLINSGGVEVSNSFEELTALTRTYLENPSHNLAQREQAIRAYCTNFMDGNATERVAGLFCQRLRNSRKQSIS